MIWCSSNDPSHSIAKGSIPAESMCNPKEIQGAQGGCRGEGEDPAFFTEATSERQPCVEMEEQGFHLETGWGELKRRKR